MQGEGLLPVGFDSWISAAFLVCYGAGQFINGRLVARSDPRRFMAAGLCASGLCNVLMAVAGNRFLMLALWALNGYATSMLWPTVIRVFSEWLDDGERARAGADVSVSIPAGMIVCYLICSAMLPVGWRFAFILAGLLLVAGAAAWFFSVGALGGRIRQKVEACRVSAPDGASGAAGGGGRKGSLTLSLFFACGLGVMIPAALFNGALKEGVASWIPKLLAADYGFVPSAASMVAVVIPAVSIAGPYAAVALTRRVFRNECITMAVLFAVSALCGLGLYLISGSGRAVPALILLAVEAACMWGVNSQLMSYVAFHFRGLGLSSAVSGTLNAILFAGSSSFTVLYGRMADASGGWRAPAIAWTAVGLAAAVCCLAGARSWARRRPGAREEEGN